MRAMSIYPFGVLHLHAPSLHIAETLADVPNIRAINVYFDSPTVTLQAALPTLQRLQARHMPLILAKDVYAGFSLDEYREIMDSLSPAGLSVHLRADSIEEGRSVMAQVQAHATDARRRPPLRMAGKMKTIARAPCHWFSEQGGGSMPDSIQELVAKYRDIVHSPRNQANALVWDQSFLWERANWRAVPRKPFCFVTEPARVFAAPCSGSASLTIIRDPRAHLAGWLKQMIFRFEHFADDTYFPPYYAPWWGIVTEASFFGIPFVFRADKDPVLDGSPLEDKAALNHADAGFLYQRPDAQAHRIHASGSRNCWATTCKLSSPRGRAARYPRPCRCAAWIAC